MGIQTVPCIIADELTEEQINLFRLVDNKTSEYSDWDFEKLKSELSRVDLTLEKNQLLLDRFELSAEVFDIEPEQAEIKIPAFNFMGVNDKPKQKKPQVSTIHSPDVVGGDDVEVEPSIPEAPEAARDDTAPVHNFTADVPRRGQTSKFRKRQKAWSRRKRNRERSCRSANSDSVTCLSLFRR